ncbi:hypothetical protein [Candidatus Poriferisocius sp.]|uniref:Nmad2 family putative nucleotide modification protein n=1 Tax=Candidatus Poriferisocius sp. TaxID=3101276 RepID=UPI003B01803E
MNLFVYVVRHDIGFAPNPFYGYCTLATCKPKIRKAAQLGDWVAGVGSVQKRQGGKLVYAMQVEEAMCFNEYWNDSRFLQKRPFRPGSIKQRYGDNIYHRETDRAEWIQEDGRHSLEDGSPNFSHIRKDTNPPRVLISRNFVYFGNRAVDLPEQFVSPKNRRLFVGMRDFHRNFPDDVKDAFIEWIEVLCDDGGIRGEPLDW